MRDSLGRNKTSPNKPLAIYDLSRSAGDKIAGYRVKLCRQP